MLLQYLTMTENTKVQRKYTSDSDDPWKWFSQFERHFFCFQGRLYNTVTKLPSTFNIYSIQTKSYTWNFAIVISLFFLKNKLFFFMCMVVLPMYMSVHHMCACCFQRPEDNIGSLETGATGGHESPYGCWKKLRSSERVTSDLNH